MFDFSVEDLLEIPFTEIRAIPMSRRYTQGGDARIAQVCRIKTMTGGLSTSTGVLFRCQTVYAFVALSAKGQVDGLGNSL
jgi:hypothetical protein